MSNPYNVKSNDIAETLEALKKWIILVEKRLSDLEKKSIKKISTQDLKFLLDLIKDDEAKEFWKQTYSGELTAQDLANELADMHIMISNVPKIVNAVTGGLLSYATYPAETVIGKFNDYVDEVVKESIEDYKEENQPQPLSYDEIMFIGNCDFTLWNENDLYNFARAIEKKHGIG